MTKGISQSGQVVLLTTLPWGPGSVGKLALDCGIALSLFLSADLGKTAGRSAFLLRPLTLGGCALQKT